MACLGSKHCGDGQVVMALTVLLLLPLYVLSLSTVPAAQQLSFLVVYTSVEVEQNKTNLVQRNTRFLVGHSLKVVCQYASRDGTDYCARRPDNGTNLVIMPVDRKKTTLIEENMVVEERTKCRLIVEMHNVSTAFEGQYNCTDTLNPSQFSVRTFEVGEMPVAPDNFSMVYEPKANITLLLNPVKTGLDLNDQETTWTITYTWRDSLASQSCKRKASDVRCRDLTAEGLCQPCTIQLKKYRGCGDYNNMGAISTDIRFSWTVENVFGKVTAQIPWTVSVTDWVKPGPVSQVKVRVKATTSSSLVVRVFPPDNIDQAHLYLMEPDDPLRVEYSVVLLSARHQSLLLNSSAHFLKTYGFVRNLEDDEMALENSLLQANFSGLSGVFQWISHATRCGNPDRSPTPQKVTIGHLPFSGYHYNVSFSTRAHYWGPRFYLNAAQAATTETAPLEGPGLHESFSACLPPSTGLCVTCIVYFQEVPQVKRGGEVINHTLHVLLTNTLTSSTSERCGNRDGVTLTTGGQNNTFLLADLAVGGVYDVLVQAVTSQGPSPTTIWTLRVTSSPPDLAPVDIVLEGSGASYDLSWKPGSVSGDVSLTYYAHYCYTIPLQLQQSPNVSTNGSVEAPWPLNCVTNMKMKTLSKQSATSVVFDQVDNYPGLTLAFFVSAVGPSNQSSGLQTVDCFYARGKYPRAVDGGTISATPVEGDPSSLVVKFTLPCGPDLSYRDGRPYVYAVGMVPDSGSCESHCGELMQGLDVTSHLIRGHLKDQVVYTRRHLQPHSPYCVGVNVAGQNGYLREESWQCVAATTGKVGESNIVEIAAAVVSVTVVIAIAAL